MKKLKKFAFYKTAEDSPDMAALYAGQREAYVAQMKEQEVEQCRVYSQEIGNQTYVFSFFESYKDVSCEGRAARHVYEFKVEEGEDLSGLSSDGLLIGVADGMLDEYVRLHDEQPPVIHDLCYQNGFRKSSIFAFEVSPGDYYLLQFVEFKGEENPELYENRRYQEWLEVTGRCQRPLPGESFWKSMNLIYEYHRQE